MPLLHVMLSTQEFHAFTNGMRLFLHRMEKVNGRLELAEAVEEFLSHCEGYPFVRSLLEKALPRGPYSPAYRKLLLANMLVQGQLVKSPSLRLTLDQIEAARVAAPMQNELIRRNEIIHVENGHWTWGGYGRFQNERR